MNVVWVKVGGLWPVNTGGRLRSFHILEALARRHRLTLITTHGPGDDPQGLERRLASCEVVSFPHAPPKHGSPGFAAALARSWLSRLPVDLWKWRVPALRRELEARLARGGVDVVVADFLSTIPNLPPAAGVPVVFFEHNVEHVIWRRLAENEALRLRLLLLAVEWRKLRRREAEACAAASLTLAVSEPDRDALARLAGAARVAAIPTGVDTAYFQPNGRPEAPGRLVFTGSMDWFPNEDGVGHFMDAVLPLVRRRRPHVTLSVVGRSPSPRLQALASRHGVTVTGRVEDVRPYVAEAELYVVPLRIGGGTRLKIFEALAMGKAVVSTTVGAEGLPLVPSRDFVRADGPEAFAAAVVRLLDDPAGRRALGAAGRRLVLERYSWDQVALEFEQRCREGMSACRG